MSSWLSGRPKDPAAAAKKKEEKEARAVLALRALLESEAGRVAAQQLVQGECTSCWLFGCAQGHTLSTLMRMLQVENCPPQTPAPQTPTCSAGFLRGNGTST